MRRSQREADFTDFYLARATALRRTAYVIVRDWHTAEDLTQQALVKVYAAWPRIRVETREAYARRAVVNACLSHLRRRRPEQPTDRLPERAATETDVPLDHGSLAGALADLPPRQRAIVALRFLDDLSVEETAHALEIATGTVKSQTSAALRTLRGRLPDLHLASTESDL